MFKKLDDNPFGRNEFNLDPVKESPGAWINPQSYNRYDKSKEVLCSGGANVGIVKHDGKIYRCFHDLTPIGDMLDYPNCMYKKAMPCRVGAICDNSGDLMSCKTWGRPNVYEKNPIATRWIENNDPNNLKMEYSYWNITPTYACGLRCPPCCNAYGVDSNEPRQVLKNERTLEEYKKFYDELYKNCKKIELVYIGGEPTAYYKIDELIQYGADLGFYGSMVSNFTSENRLKKIAEVKFSSPEMFSFSISIHPFEENKNRGFSFDRVLKYASLFKERGHKVRACILAWPDIIKYYFEYKPILEKLGIPFFLKPVGGYDNHPGFTPELKKIIYDEGGYRETCEFLNEINWVSKIF